MYNIISHNGMVTGHLPVLGFHKSLWNLLPLKLRLVENTGQVGIENDIYVFQLILQRFYLINFTTGKLLIYYFL